MRNFTKIFLTAVILLATFGFSIAQSSDNDILEYSFPEQTGDATITQPVAGIQNGKVDIKVKYCTDLTDLVAKFKLSDGASAKIGTTGQESEVTHNDFTNTVTYTIVAENGDEQDWDVSVTIDDPDAKILAYSFAEQTGDATITDPATAGSNGTIDIEVKYGTDLTNLVATFELSCKATAEIGTTDQVSGTTANDFSSSPVTYTVTSDDGNTTIDWDVNVSVAPNDSNDILEYSFAEQVEEATISRTSHTISIVVASGTDKSDLVATFKLSTNASATVGGAAQVSGSTSNDFTNDVVYTVKAENDSTQDWTIHVRTEDEANDANDIIEYSFAEQTGAATINTSDHTVNIEVANGTDLTNLVATFTLSENATAKVDGTVQTSGSSANDFSGDVIYTVTAENGDVQAWKVQVSVATTTNIYSNTNNNFKLYPNPSNGVLNIDLPNNKGFNLYIINLQGKIVLDKEINEVHNTVNLDYLDNGLYFVKIFNGQKVYTKKISIVK